VIPLLLACAVATRAAQSATHPPQEIDAAVIRYRVVASLDAAELVVELELPAGLDSALAIDPDAAAFVEEVRSVDAARAESRPLHAIGGGVWALTGCGVSRCLVQYRFHLRAAAQALDDPDMAAVRGDALVAPMSSWLLRPAHLAQPGNLGARELHGLVHVVVPSPLTFLTGLPRVAHEMSESEIGRVREMERQGEGESQGQAGGTYVFSYLPHFVSPYAAFGRFHRETLSIGGAKLELGIAAPDLMADTPRVRAWIVAAAEAVSRYFGRFPVDGTLILVVPQLHGLHGKEMGGGGASVLIQMEPGCDLRDPRFEWQAAHEMVHLAVPELDRSHMWLTEGLATYVEPFARVMTGELPSEKVWRDLVAGLPLGMPAPGDRGLDHTHSWGRTYWGGALFAFVADIEIRKATAGQRSLGTALRGVLAAGGDTRVLWTVDRFASVCDRAVGRAIVTKLYQHWRDRPVHVELDSVWRDLGISIEQKQLKLDERAPLAPIRRQMAEPVGASVNSR
jgi:hypothetical protein